MHLGLIGKSLSHSWSKRYFEQKFEREGLADHRYELFELDRIEQFPELSESNHELVGLNVTVPYKESIIPYLADLSPAAKSIGAVNTLKRTPKGWTGHNTDVIGFEKLLAEVGGEHQGPALILGTGGASKAVQYVLRHRAIQFQLVSRSAEKGLTYDQLTPTLIQNHPLIIQTTPVGMFPDGEAVLPFPFEALTSQHVVIDLIYNPEETEFMKRAVAQGATVANGLAMLHGQAEESWGIWEESR